MAIFNYEIFSQDYNTFHKDRADGYGGVFIASRNHVVSYELPLDTSCELIVCKIITDDKPLIFCSAYRPPDNNSIYLEKLCQVLNNIISNNPDHVIWIAGDINFSNIDWTSNSIRWPSYPTLLCDQILDLLDIHGLTQIVDFPTRVNNILDEFITKRPSLINRC